MMITTRDGPPLRWMLRRVYRIPHLPDVHLSRHRARHGGMDAAWSALSLAVYDFAVFLTALARADTVAVRLRYSFDPARAALDRLRLHVLVSQCMPDAAPETALQSAERLLATRLGRDEALPVVAAAEAGETLEQCHEIAQIMLGDALRCVDSSEGRGLQPVYSVRRFTHLAGNGAVAAGWDELFADLTQPLVVDLSLARAGWDQPFRDGWPPLVLDLYEEIRALAGLASARGFAGRDAAAMRTEAESRRERRSLGAERVREGYAQIVDAFEEGPVFSFNLHVASTVDCQDVARMVAARLAPEESLEVVCSGDPGRVRQRLLAAEHRSYLNPQGGYFSQIFTVPRSEDCPTAAGDDRWRRLSRLKHLVPAEVAQELLRLPMPRGMPPRTCLLETDRVPELPRTETAPGTAMAGGLSGRGAIRLGKDNLRGVPAVIPLEQLNKHLFVAGVTGSGKTTSVLEILCQLAEQGIPFLVIEPTKREYRRLLKHPLLRETLRVYTCGDEALSPLKLNPFEFAADRVPLDEHLGVLESCFKGALPLFSPLTEILLETLEQVYRDRGWKAGVRGHFPAIRDLPESLAKVLDTFHYSDNLANDIATAARVRLTSLGKRMVGSVLDHPRSLPGIEELLRHPTVIELDRLSQEHANLITLFLLQLVNRQLRLEPAHGLRHVLVVEEAHNIVGNVALAAAQDNSVSPRAEATAFMVKMLAEVRALGEGIIIADQTPAAVAPEVLKNTGVKLIHRTVAGDDRDSVADSMLLTDTQNEELARLGSGECFLYHEFLYRPQRITVERDRSLADGHALPDTTDRELRGWLQTRSWYQDALAHRSQVAAQRAAEEETAGFFAVARDPVRLRFWQDRVNKLQGWLLDLERELGRTAGWRQSERLTPEQQAAHADVQAVVGELQELLEGGRWQSLRNELAADFPASEPQGALQAFFLRRFEQQRERLRQLAQTLR